jgi:hypothetical protein
MFTVARPPQVNSFPLSTGRTPSPNRRESDSLGSNGGVIMEQIRPGMKIKIPCKVRPGPFSDDRLITLNTVDGYISGFVKEKDLITKDGKQFIGGVVQLIETHHLVVMVKGSFFTTNGIANIPRETAMAA